MRFNLAVVGVPSYPILSVVRDHSRLWVSVGGFMWFLLVAACGGAFRAFGAVLMYSYVAVSALFFSLFLFGFFCPLSSSFFLF